MGRKRKGNNKDIPKRVYWHRNQWQYKARDDEKIVLGKVWTPLGSELSQMFIRYAELKELLHSAGGMDKLFTKFEVEILHCQSNPANYSERTIKDKLDHIKKLRPVFGQMHPSSVRPTHCAAYLDKRGQVSKSQANQEFNTLAACLKWAVRWGVIDRNPCQGISRHKLKARTRSPSLDELRGFKSVSSPFIQCWVDLKFMTGLRQKDMLDLRVDQCDFNGEGISVRTSKTNKAGIIYWNNDLRDCIRKILSQNKVQGTTVFCDKRGCRISLSNFKARWHKAMKNALKVKAIEESFWEHDIRSRFAIESEKQGIDATDQLLHENPKQKETYLRERKATKVTALSMNDFKKKK